MSASAKSRQTAMNASAKSRQTAMSASAKSRQTAMSASAKSRQTAMSASAKSRQTAMSPSAKSRPTQLTRPLSFGVFITPFHPVGQSPTVALEYDLERTVALDRLGFGEARFREHQSRGHELFSVAA